VIHAQGGPGGVLLWKKLGAPLVYTAHHTYRQAHRRGSVKRMLNGVEARSYRGAAMVLPVSRSTANALLEMRIPASRIEVVSNGVDAVDLPGVEHEDGRVLFVSRMEPEKGALDAIALLQALTDADSNAHGVMVGGGTLAAEVQRAAGASGGRIEYLGALDRDALNQEYARAAVVVMPSRFEGLGMVALEAQAAGTPVAGFDVDGLRDAVGLGGVLAPAGDLAALRVVTADLLSDPARRKELGDHGREVVLAEHSWDAIGARLEEIYRSLL
jgi:glycosyltransferase involved in cell wall biosynthesis